ncbi:ankyrin repeat domain-containing protein [Leptospira yasudae]|uniref:ankyrin repeat domain-containing protein n=1 Tax=Leptospira yasudae TaxID=2202201 RepID=UPI001C4E3C8A|nr:ankyrin repeat domain-containing protein [Leptospira yasudae]MBW0435456.1 ankyrin repeat domain-containing protein [Leptospira yasudae]
MKRLFILIFVVSCISSKHIRIPVYNYNKERELIAAIKGKNKNNIREYIRSDRPFRRIDFKYLYSNQLKILKKHGHKSSEYYRDLIAALETDYYNYPYTLSLSNGMFDIADEISEKSRKQDEQNPFKEGLDKYLAKGGDPNRIVKFDTTLLMLCIINGSNDCARTLIKYGANIERESKVDLLPDSNRKGLTALVYAVKKGNAQIVKELLSVCASTNVTDEDNESLILISQRHKFKEIEQLLRDYEKNIYCD